MSCSDGLHEWDNCRCDCGLFEHYVCDDCGYVDEDELEPPSLEEKLDAVKDERDRAYVRQGELAAEVAQLRAKLEQWRPVVEAAQESVRKGYECFSCHAYLFEEPHADDCPMRGVSL